MVYSVKERFKLTEEAKEAKDAEVPSVVLGGSKASFSIGFMVDLDERGENQGDPLGFLPWGSWVSGCLLPVATAGGLMRVGWVPWVVACRRLWPRKSC